MSRIYVRQVVVELTNYKNAEALLDEAIQKETKTGAVFRTITSLTEGSAATYVIVFERT